MVIFVDIWVKCSASWLGDENVKYWKGIFCQIIAHMLISITPKYAVSQVVGFIKGKSAIHIARNYIGHKKNFTGQHFWARGFHVSIVGTIPYYGP